MMAQSYPGVGTFTQQVFFFRPNIPAGDDMLPITMSTVYAWATGTWGMHRAHCFRAPNPHPNTHKQRQTPKYTHSHARTCAHMRTCIHTPVHTHTHTYQCTHTHTNAHTHTHTHSLSVTFQARLFWCTCDNWYWSVPLNHFILLSLTLT